MNTIKTNRNKIRLKEENTKMTDELKNIHFSLYSTYNEIKITNGQKKL